MAILTGKQQALYDAFYESTHEGDHLDTRTELLVGLAAALALNCQPCTRYYLTKAKAEQLSKGEIAEVLAKVMAVAAGQKHLQVQEVMDSLNFDFE